MNLILRPDIPIRVNIEVGYNPIRGNLLLGILIYQEKPDTLDFIQDDFSTYLNSYFIIEGIAAPGKPLKYREKVTIDIWVCDQLTGTLTCYEWMLIDDTADGHMDRMEASLIRKTVDNLVIDVQERRVSENNRERFAALFSFVRDSLLQRAGFSSAADIFMRQQIYSTL